MAKKETVKSPKKGRVNEPSTWVITIVVMAVACGFGIFLPHRLLVLLSVALCAVSIISIVAAFKGKEILRIASWGLCFGVVAALVSLMGFVYTLGAYSFYKEPFIPFWEISLTLGLAVGIFVTVKWIWTGTGWGGRIGSIALCAVLVFFLCCLALCHLNYLLDFQPPVEKKAVIEEKDIILHHKSPDSYEFEMTVDGEPFYLEVKWAEYQRYEVGDTYTFKEYRGAFGKPFYIAED